MWIKNGLVFIEGAFYSKDIRIGNGRILEIGKMPETNSYTNENEIYDGAGTLIFPGFLDTHIHGFNGAACAAGEKDVRKVSAGLPRFGVTGYVPTLSQPDAESTLRAVKGIRGAKDAPGADILGIHIDMPYRHRTIPYYPISIPPTKAHTMSMVDNDLSDILILCAAPELPGAFDWFQWVRSNGIIAEAGNTECSADDMKEAANSGVTLLNHFYNGYEKMDHHFGGAVVGGLLEDRMYAQLTCDGIHVAKEFIELTIRAKGVERIVPVTDCSHFQGMPEGEYTYGSKEIERKVFYKDGAVRDENGKLVTGAHTFDENMRTMRSFGYSMEEIGIMFAENPGKAIQLKDRGKIEVGRKADLAIMDQDLHVVCTFINGRKAYCLN